MHGLMDFILYIFEQDNEDQLWAVWLAKDIEEDFVEFKKDKVQSLRTRKTALTSEKEAVQNIEFAAQYVKPRKEVTDGSGDI